MKYWTPAILSGILIAGCALTPSETKIQDEAKEFVDLSKREKPEAIIADSWHSVTITTPDISETARFWTQIARYETVYKNYNSWVLRAPDTTDGYIHLKYVDGFESEPARPLDATAWDTGCYWSVMFRAKDIPSIVEDAKRLGWEPLTDIAYLKFGESELNIVVLRHYITGAQVQLYERLTTPLPDGFPVFDRVSRPFNIMQMVDDRDEAYDFFQQGLGFETFYYGKPYMSPEPAIMPLGIPEELTNKVPYKAAIVYPETGMEWGRFEMIEIEGEKYGLEGRDFSDRCHSQNWGIISVNYRDVDSIAFKKLEEREVEFHDTFWEWINVISRFELSSPDGALISFDIAKEELEESSIE